jgi:hypothetical protein
MSTVRCRSQGRWFVSGDGRVAKEVAAQVLDLAVGTLANRRAEGSTPPHYRIGQVIY